MREFREALDFCNFRDLGFVGSPFTWCNNHFEAGVTWIRLDRGVATPLWSQMFPTVQVHHVARTLSDHCPLWLSSDNENARFYKRNRPFRLKAVSLKDERCEGVIKHAWDGQNSGEKMQRAMSKIDACCTSLRSWSRLSFGNICQTLAQKKKQLAEEEPLSMGGLNHDQVKILKEEVYDLMVKEDCMWHQWSQVDWLKRGDMNTNYLHNRATQRNKRNFISKLVLEDGAALVDENSIGATMVDYFKKIFTLASPS